LCAWSVLKDSIPAYLEAAGRDGRSHDFLTHEASSILLQLRRAKDCKDLYQLACMHRQFHSPLINRLFFSGLNLVRDRFGDFFIDLLIQELAPAAYFPRPDRPRPESAYAAYLEGGLPDIFPELVPIKKEAVFDHFRVDLLAKMPSLQRDVLFELKLGGEDPTPQLLRYAPHFRGPVLIGLTEKQLRPRQMHKDVYYFTYAMLNRRAGENICRHFSSDYSPACFSACEFDRDFPRPASKIKAEA
jgi:hypothetical protein